jgi:hypothetical protein
MPSTEGFGARARGSGIRLDRRRFLAHVTRRGVGIGVAGMSLPALLAACSSDDGDDAAETAAGRNGQESEQQVEGSPIVGDVLDFALESNEWQGAFGFVTLRLRRGSFDGKDVYYIRTDTSDDDFASQEGLVPAPMLGELLGGKLSGRAYEVMGGPDDQPTVLSSEPGRPDYTPAWRLHRVEWSAQPSALGSEADIAEHEGLGHLTVERTDIIINGSVVKWSNGEMPTDDERTQYLGPGQLLEPPDTDSMEVTFKLHECFPEARYIVCDTSMEPMAAGMNIAHSPALAGSTDAGATGRTNVFMGGTKGPGPMGFQPSVFDSTAGNPEWSPYWDHMTYAWKDDATSRVLATEEEIHQARDDGELEEFPGTPDTKGEIFVVNCPVPVLAPNTFTG